MKFLKLDGTYVNFAECILVELFLHKKGDTSNMELRMKNDAIVNIDLNNNDLRNLYNSGIINDDDCIELSEFLNSNEQPNKRNEKMNKKESFDKMIEQKVQRDNATDIFAYHNSNEY